MPYIKQKKRDELDPHLKAIAKILVGQNAQYVAGNLNYVITKLILQLWDNCRSYHMGNAIVGALHCAAAEFIRRSLSPYEDDKIKQNGDVYPFPRQ